MIILSDKIYVSLEYLGRYVTELCEEFTYNNPQYWKNKRMGFSVARVPKTMTNYTWATVDGKKCLAIPRGGRERLNAFILKKGLQFLRPIDRRTKSETNIDFNLSVGKELKNGYSLELSANQHDIIDMLVKHEGGLIQAAPGIGKTIATFGFIDRIKQPTLIIVHTSVLQKQWVEELKEKTHGEYTLGVLGGSSKKQNPDADVVVAIINSVYNKCFGEEQNKEWLNRFGTVMFDECLDPDTVIAVPSGLKLLKDIQVGDDVCTPSGGVAKVKNKWITHKKAYKYSCHKGNYLIASENHLVPNNKSVDNIKSGFGIIPISQAKHLYLPNNALFKNEQEFNYDDYFYGWFLGDGTCDRNYIKFGFSKKKKEFQDLFEDNIKFKFFENSRGDLVYSLSMAESKYYIDKYGIQNGKKNINMFLPDEIYKSASISFLKGIFDADGCQHINNGKLKQNFVDLSLTLKNVVYQILDMLKVHGIAATVNVIAKKNKNANLAYRISIYGRYLDIFNEKIGFNLSYKRRASSYKVEDKLFKSKDIRSIEDAGYRDLIDIELDNDEKLFIANGFVVHNCHHISSKTFKDIVDNATCKWKVGVTGTVERKDGMQIFTYDSLGKILIDIKEGEAKDRITDFDFYQIDLDIPIDIPMRTAYLGRGQKSKNIDFNAFADILTTNEDRNNRIVAEVSADIDKGRIAMVLATRVEHAKLLFEKLSSKYKGYLIIHETNKDENLLKTIKADAGMQFIVINAKIGSEGLDIPRLDALYTTMPSSNYPQLKQQLARVRRFCEGKPLPFIKDFVDNLAMVPSMKNGVATKEPIFSYTALGRKKFYKKLKKEYLNS